MVGSAALVCRNYTRSAYITASERVTLGLAGTATGPQTYVCCTSVAPFPSSLSLSSSIMSPERLFLHSWRALNSL